MAAEKCLQMMLFNCGAREEEKIFQLQRVKATFSDYVKIREDLFGL